MRLIVALVLSAFLASCSDKTPQAQPAGKAAAGSASSARLSAASSTPAVGQAEAYRIGLSSFEIPFTEFLAHFKYDATDIADGSVSVSQAKKTLFSLSDKNNLQDKRVRMIEIYSPDIQTENGIHVGMSINDLMQKFPDLPLDYWEVGSEECFYIPLGNVQTQTKGSQPVEIVAFVSSNNGKELATKGLKALSKSKESSGPWPYPTKEFSKEGSISRILILE